MTTEFYRPVAAERLAGREIEVTANTEECAALAKRLLLPDIAALSCTWRFSELPAGEFSAQGRLRARITQICVVTLEPFESDIDEAFIVRFVPEDRMREEDEDPEIDEVPFDGRTIDLGEATAEELALALDPFPHAPGAELPEGASDPRESPFGKLKDLN